MNDAAVKEFFACALSSRERCVIMGYTSHSGYKVGVVRGNWTEMKASRFYSNPTIEGESLNGAHKAGSPGPKLNAPPTTPPLLLVERSRSRLSVPVD